MSIVVPDGEAAGMSYLVQYDENLWKSYDEKTQDFCKTEWLRKAKVVPNCRMVALRLIPDALFPLHGHDAPYIEWQERFEVAEDTPDFVYSEVTVACQVEWTPRLQRQIMSNLQHVLPRGTKFRITTKSGQELSTGRV